MRYMLLALAVIVSWSAFGNPQFFSDTKLCQAAIAVNNGHSVKVVKVISSHDNIVQVSYLRPSDGKRFKFWCKIEPTEIRWRDEYIGRWAQNLRVYYKFLDEGKTLEIRSVIVGEEQYPDIKTFTLKDFR